MPRVKDKVAIVTGAASVPGLGNEIARTLAREGASVVVSDIDEAGARACAETIEKNGGKALALKQDVTDEAAWAATVDKAVAAYGRLDILVNNAGIAVLRTLEQMTLADFERQIDVNLTSVFLGTKYAVPAMLKSGGGSIVNLSSVAGLVGIPGVSAYAASKAGVRLFSKAIAMEYAQRNIRCNSVHPGVILTNMQQVAIEDNPEQYEAINNSIPMKHMGEPADIANCVLYLASDESKYVTGAEFVVDGGLTAQ
ncbi:MAG: glucose 1-dehydrogenase [Alphaproteobacteria bacterium]|nr:MAG: glucose 1-dehydrogenase [Alphaproteobacteria bacterium]